MPRIFGYLFNPASFWLCYHQDKLIAVIAEVNNTFKETRSYMCHKNGDEINSKFWFQSQKDFHVSLFYPRQGYYKFNFKIPEFMDSYPESLHSNSKTQIIINYYDNDKLQLGTAITVNAKKLSSRNLIKKIF